MKNLAILLSTALSLVTSAYDTVTIVPGESHRSTFPAKIARVQVLSSVASGTATVKSESVAAVSGNSDVVTATTNFTYTVIYTNGTSTITNTLAFNPEPYGLDNVISFVTNTVITSVTNKVPTSGGSVTVTNELTSALTCSGGTVSASPESAWIFPGDLIFVEGTARGRVNLILER